MNASVLWESAIHLVITSNSKKVWWQTGNGVPRENFAFYLMCNLETGKSTMLLLRSYVYTIVYTIVCYKVNFSFYRTELGGVMTLM